MPLLLAVAAGPQYRDFISAGTYVLVTLITVLGSVQIALITRASNNAKKAADLAEPTGNGYASSTTASLQQLERSVQSLHGRMDERARHANRRNEHLDEVLTNFDNRLTHIEEKL